MTSMTQLYLFYMVPLYTWDVSGFTSFWYLAPATSFNHDTFTINARICLDKPANLKVSLIFLISPIPECTFAQNCPYPIVQVHAASLVT